MDTTLRGILHCCVILITLLHGGSGDSRDQEIRKAVIARRIKEIVNGRDNLNTFIIYLRNEKKRLQKPGWTDFYLEVEVHALFVEIEKKKPGYLETAKQIEQTEKDLEFLKIPIEAKEAKENLDSAAEEWYILKDEMLKIREELLVMYEDIQKRKGDLNELRIFELRRKMKSISEEYNQMKRDSVSELKKNEIRQKMMEVKKELDEIEQIGRDTLAELAELKETELLIGEGSSSKSKPKHKGKGKGKSKD